MLKWLFLAKKYCSQRIGFCQRILMLQPSKHQSIKDLITLAKEITRVNFYDCDCMHAYFHLS